MLVTDVTDRARAEAALRVSNWQLGEERARLWQVMLRTWPNYAKYEERTDRVIPVFLLERR